MEHIRKATEQDLARIAEILVFNNRINFFPIFRDESYSFRDYNVLEVVREHLENESELLRATYVYDDGIVRGLIRIMGHEVVKLFVDPFFQGRGIGAELLEYGVREHRVNCLWALEKNTRAIEFYGRHGFFPNGERCFEEDTTEYLLKLVRKA